MEIKKMMVGELQTNMYIVVDEKTKNCVIIDPSSEASRAIDYITKEKLNLKGMLVTHGHFDHIEAISGLNEFCKVPVFAHEQEAIIMENADKNLSHYFYHQGVIRQADTYLKDQEVLDLGGELVFTCLEVPGHSPHSLCYYHEESQSVFTGDTLMAGCIGRMDLFDGPEGVLIQKIKEKLLTLPEKTRVYPGHGDNTTIKNESKYNPYLAL
jgi:glyoxylase-like metal-dependent hydrolase (beta-lactamase superfamily II)